MTNKRDSFYEMGGTYKSKFTDRSSNIDIKVKNQNKETYMDLLRSNHEHHNFALLDADYKDMYKRAENMPHQNINVPIQQSVKKDYAYLDS